MSQADPQVAKDLLSLDEAVAIAAARGLPWRTREAIRTRLDTRGGPLKSHLLGRRRRIVRASLMRWLELVVELGEEGATEQVAREQAAPRRRQKGGAR